MINESECVANFHVVVLETEHKTSQKVEELTSQMKVLKERLQITTESKDTEIAKLNDNIKVHKDGNSCSRV